MTAAVAQAIQNGVVIQAFGSYAVVLQQEYGWSKAMLALAYSFNRSESAVLGPGQGWALDRINPIKVMRAGVILLAAGLCLLSMASTPAQFWGAFLVLTVGSGLAGFLTIVTIVVRRVTERRARALSIVGLGVAFGGLLNPLVVLMLKTVGWRWSLRISAIVLVSVLWGATVLIGRGERKPRPTPVPVLTTQVSEPSPSSPAVDDTDVSVRDALRSRTFWLVSIGHMSALLIVSTAIAHLSLFLVNERDLSLGQASFVVGAIPIFQIIGIAVVARLGDELDKRHLAFGAMVAHACALFLLAQFAGPVVLALFVILQGTAWGVRGPLMQAIRADHFGVRSFGALMGFSSIILTVGIVGGPLIAGYSADHFDSYVPAFTFLSVVALAGGVSFLLIGQPGPAPVVTMADRTTVMTDRSAASGALTTKGDSIMERSVAIERDNDVAVVILDRPEVLNALTVPMLDELGDAVEQLGDDDSVAVIVLIGRGRAFCAGVDLKELQRRPLTGGRVGADFDDAAARVTALLATTEKPTIAAVNGACFTGGLELALACDVVVASASAIFGDTHAKWGLRPTWGMTQRLIRSVGPSRARLLSYTARTFDGTTAVEYGLASECYPADEFRDRVSQLGAEIAANSRASLAAYKDLYLVAQNTFLDDGLAGERARDYAVGDAAERLSSFGAAR